MTRIVRNVLLGAGLCALAGCNHEDSAETTAREALGIKETGEQTTGRRERDLIVIDEKTVKDAKTGAILSDKKTVTPVKVEIDDKQDVDVNAGKPVSNADKDK
jgi:hypothetical protein